MRHVNKYEFVVDKENKTVSFAGETWDSFRILTSNSEPLSMLGNFRGSPKKINKEFTEQYGITPTNFRKKFNGLMGEIWIDPVRKHVKRFAYSVTRKIIPHKLLAIHEMLPVIEQAEKDGNYHLVPWIISKKADPKKLREVYGKSIWKQICKQSMSRNKYIVNLADHNHAIQHLLSAPSWLLKQGRNGHFSASESTEYVMKFADFRINKQRKDFASQAEWRNYYLKLQELQRLIDIYKDTKRMAVQLGRPFRTDWSPEKLKEKHQEYSEAVLANKYSSETFEHLIDFKHKIVEHRGYTARLLDSPMSIYQEGKAMHHCVGMYSGYVAQKEYLVYTVTKDGKKTSTIGITRDVNKWRLQQQYGLCNASVNCSDERELAEKVVILLNKPV